MTYKKAVVHAVCVGSNDSEVFDSLRWRRVRDVEGHSQVIPDRAELAFEGAGQGALGKSEAEGVSVLTSRHDGDASLLVLVCNKISLSVHVSAIKSRSSAMNTQKVKYAKNRRSWLTFSPDDALFIYEVLILLGDASLATAHDCPLNVRLSTQHDANT